MSDKLLYDLQITIEDRADITEVETQLEDVLLDLYNVESVEGILVKDRTPPIDEDMDKLLSVIDRIENKDIRRSVDLVQELSE